MEGDSRHAVSHCPCELPDSGVGPHGRYRSTVEPCSEENWLNLVGYRLLRVRADVDAAIAVFKLNTELHPESANTWDSLGEGYMVAGRKELAIANYKRSLELEPGTGNAVRMLERPEEP